MKRSLWTLAILGGLVISACQRDAAPAAANGHEATKAAEAAAAATPIVAPVAVADTPMPANGETAFDTKSFAGTFTGTLPCADCPGIDARLVLQPDGRFVLEESRPAGGAAVGIEGTWTTEDKDTHVRLDPDAKSEPDRQFAIVTSDRLSPLDEQGQRASGNDDFGLSRSSRE